MTVLPFNAMSHVCERGKDKRCRRRKSEELALLALLAALLLLNFQQSGTASEKRLQIPSERKRENVGPHQ